MKKILMIACLLAAITLSSCLSQEGATKSPPVVENPTVGNPPPSNTTILQRPNVFGPASENNDHEPFTIEELLQIGFYNDGAITLIANKDKTQRRIIKGVVYNIDSTILKNHSVPSFTPMHVIAWEAGGKVLYLRDSYLKKTKLRYLYDSSSETWKFGPTTRSQYTYDKDTFSYDKASARSYLRYVEFDFDGTRSEPTESPGAPIGGSSDQSSSSDEDDTDTDTGAEDQDAFPPDGHIDESTGKIIRDDPADNSNPSNSNNGNSNNGIKRGTQPQNNNSRQNNSQQNNPSTKPAKKGGGLQPRNR